MALIPCEVCDCVPGEIPNDTFKQNVLLVLCSIMEGSQTAWEGGHLVSASGTNVTTIKSSAGRLGYVDASNITATPVYVRFYNKVAPNPAVDSPIHIWIIPGDTLGAGTNIPLPSQGVNFDTAISFAITSGGGETDNTGVTAGNVIVNYGFK